MVDYPIVVIIVMSIIDHCLHPKLSYFILLVLQNILLNMLLKYYQKIGQFPQYYYFLIFQIMTSKPLLVGIHTLNYSTTLTRSKICPVYNQCRIFTNYISTYDLLKNFLKKTYLVTLILKSIIFLSIAIFWPKDFFSPFLPKWDNRAALSSYTSLI